MTLFRPHQEADALAYAAAGGQALFLPARPSATGLLIDRDIARLVRTARDLVGPSVRVLHTCTDRQHVVLEYIPLLVACLRAHDADNASLIDLVGGFAAGGYVGLPIQLKTEMVS